MVCLHTLLFLCWHVLIFIIQDFIICIEMALAAIAHHVRFESSLTLKSCTSRTHSVSSSYYLITHHNLCCGCALSCFSFLLARISFFFFRCSVCILLQRYVTSQPLYHIMWSHADASFFFIFISLLTRWLISFVCLPFFLCCLFGLNFLSIAVLLRLS